MAKPDWNARFATGDYIFGTAPAQVLSRNADLLPETGRALAVADGEGRNSVWLAQRGLDVTAWDTSENALVKARKLAEGAGVTVDFRLADAEGYDWGAERFDLVAAIFVQFAGPPLKDAMLDGMKRATKPGGTLLLHGYRPKQIAYGTGGPRAVENLYTEEALRDTFGDMEILRLESYDIALDEGVGHSGMSALIDLVARA